jgi:tetratricopeptide (TPR) repeat protein
VRRRLPSRYNQLVRKHAVVFVFVLVVLLLFCPSLRAQDAVGGTVLGRTMVVIPFENVSPTPGLEWLGESFPETFHQQLNSPVLYVASRDERLRAYDRQGIPAGVHASRATLYRLAEQMDVDYAVLGSYSYDGARLTAIAQLLDMRGQKLLPAATESAPLADLGNLQSALAWDLLHLIRADFAVPKDKYIASVATFRLDALENYVRGMLATTVDEKVQHYREAVRLNPDYTQAWLELGKTYYAQRAYEPAIAALGQIPRSSAVAREANFYLGLAAYAHGDMAKSEAAFEFVAARVPLAEVYNNLGVIAARSGRSSNSHSSNAKQAAGYFHRAIENDPSDADYHFNLGVTLAADGDRTGAARELHTALDRRSNDAEAKMLLDSLMPPAADGSIVPSSAVSKIPAERIKRNYEEDAFRQMTMQMGSWAEERFARSDPRAHARFHLELGKELLAHGFTTEAEAEFHHAAEVDPASTAPLTALAEDYDARGDAREARAQAEAALRIRESAEAYLILARLDLQENRMEAAAQNINRALQLEPGNSTGQDLKRTLAAKLAEKAQP